MYLCMYVAMYHCGEQVCRYVDISVCTCTRMHTDNYALCVLVCRCLGNQAKEVKEEEEDPSDLDLEFKAESDEEAPAVYCLDGAGFGCECVVVVLSTVQHISCDIL